MSVELSRWGGWDDEPRPLTRTQKRWACIVMFCIVSFLAGQWSVRTYEMPTHAKRCWIDATGDRNCGSIQIMPPGSRLLP